jgi:methionyl-tRNA formyltransferase
VVFFGTPLFAAEVLNFLLANGVDVVAVISKPDRPKGRSGHPVPTFVKQAALMHEPPLPIHQPEIVSDLSFADTLKAYDADLFVVVAYGEIIKKHLLEMPRLGCINLHASLLPKYRGAAPIQRSIMAGETESGVTVIHMVRKMDAGDMIAKAVVPIDPDTTYGELEKALCEVGKQTLLDVIRSFGEGIPPSTSQDETEMTLAPKIELEECEIDWSLPAQSLHNLVRGVNPHPGAWCFVTVRGEKKRLKVNRTRLITTDHDGQPGDILNLQQHKGNLIVASDGGQALELLEVQLEGKKPMSSEELTRGIPRQELKF